MQAATPNFIRYQVVSSLVNRAQQVTALNEFAKDNLQTYVIDRQADILNNLVTQVVALPIKYKEQEEREAKSLNHDNMMNVRRLLNRKSPKKSLSSTRKQSRSNLKRSTKTEASKVTPGLCSYMSQTKQLPLKIEQDPIQIERLRMSKQKEYAERPKQSKDTKSFHLKSSNKKWVFDYDGNIQFGVQLKNNNLLRPQLQAQVSNQNVHSNMNQAERQNSSRVIIVGTKKREVIRSQERKEKNKMRKSSVRIETSVLNLVQSDLNVQQKEGFLKETSDKTKKKDEQKKRRKTQDLFHMDSPQIKSKTTFTAERLQARSFFAKQIKERISVQDQNLKQSMISSACNIFVKLPRRSVKSVIINQKGSENKKENACVVSTRKNGAIPRIFSGNTFRIDTIREIMLKSTF